MRTDQGARPGAPTNDDRARVTTSSGSKPSEINWPTLDELHTETVGEWLELKLHKGALDGEISWTNVDAILNIVERYGILADSLYWALHERLRKAGLATRLRRSACSACNGSLGEREA